MTARLAPLALPAGLYLAAVYGAALVLLLIAAPPSAYVKVVGDPYYRMIAWNTVRFAILVTAASLIVAYPAALALARVRGVLQVLLLGSAFLPLSVGVVAKTFGWTVLLRRDGVINDLLMALHLIDEPQRLLFTEVGLILGTANIFLPFMLLPIFTVATQIDRRLYDAASTLGAGPVLTFFRVTLPLTGPGIAAGVTLVFAMTLSAYVVPTLLAGERYLVLSTQIAKAFLLARDPELGSALGVTLLVLAGGSMAVGGIRRRR